MIAFECYLPYEIEQFHFEREKKYMQTSFSSFIYGYIVQLEQFFVIEGQKIVFTVHKISHHKKKLLLVTNKIYANTIEVFLDGILQLCWCCYPFQMVMRTLLYTLKKSFITFLFLYLFTHIHVHIIMVGIL